MAGACCAIVLIVLDRAPGPERVARARLLHQPSRGAAARCAQRCSVTVTYH
jgi:hypothetical protein